MTRPRNPTSVEEITTGWLAAALGDALGGPIVDSRIIAVMHGTATKIHLEVQYNKSGQTLTETIWAKTGLEKHSHSIGQESVYAGEVYYYQNLAGKFPIRTPHCHYAHVESDTGRSIMLLADLLKIGAKFWDPTVPASVAQVSRGLESIAAWQAASWMHPILLEDSYLMGGGALRAGNIDGWVFDPKNWEEQSARPRFRSLAPALRDREAWRAAHMKLLDDWWTREPLCLSHGDCHVGQAWSAPDGSVSMLDWQCSMAASWLHDFANFTVSSLSPADRRNVEGDLLKTHMQQLRDLGAENVPDMDRAWDCYRAGALYGAAWALCKVEMQSEENCTEIAARHMAAVDDLKSVDVIYGRA